MLSYQAYWHVVAPIRCSGKGNGVITASLQIFGHQNLTLLVHNTVLGNKALWGLGMRVWEWEFGNEALWNLGMRVWERGSVESGNESLGMRLKWSGYESLGMRVWVWESGNKAQVGSGYESLGTRLRGVWYESLGTRLLMVWVMYSEIVCHFNWEEHQIKHCLFKLTTNLLSPYTENRQVLLGLPVQVSQNIHTTHTQCHWHTVQSMYHASGSTVRFDRLYRHAHVCKIHVSKSTSVLQA